MLNKLLIPEIQKYINDSLSLSVEKIALSKNPFPDVDFKDVLQQIQSKQKAKSKLPTWYNTNGILYPAKINIEQTSSEITAQYKSQIISGKDIIDLTGGFGIDTYYFSKKFLYVYHCELNPNLSSVAEHNFRKLGVKNCTFINNDGAIALQKLNKKFDWIYIDPSRRNDVKGKVFMLNDCLPNVTQLLNFYLEYSDNILIKTAPMLDITAALSELKFVKKIYIIAIDNEVKELLFEIKNHFNNRLEIATINFTKTKKEVFNYNIDEDFSVIYSLPLQFLYEPNSAIMKSGGFTALAKQYSIFKLHPNSHLYTSDNLIEFPGRIFKIEKYIKYSKVDIKANIYNTKANITVRNFHDTVENLSKKIKITSGGDWYYFFTTNIKTEKIVLICRKI